MLYKPVVYYINELANKCNELSSKTETYVAREIYLFIIKRILLNNFYNLDKYIKIINYTESYTGFWIDEEIIINKMINSLAKFAQNFFSDYQLLSYNVFHNIILSTDLEYITFADTIAYKNSMLLNILTAYKVKESALINILDCMPEMPIAAKRNVSTYARKNIVAYMHEKINDKNSEEVNKAIEYAIIFYELILNLKEVKNCQNILSTLKMLQIFDIVQIIYYHSISFENISIKNKYHPQYNNSNYYLDLYDNIASFLKIIMQSDQYYNNQWISSIFYEYKKELKSLIEKT